MILAGLLMDVLVVGKIDCSKWYELLFHIGETLVIAGLVGLVLELSEFAGYFEERLSELLSTERYLSSLHTNKLEEIAVKALEYRNSAVISNPKNQWKEYLKVVLSEILPLFQRPYRANYSEVIHLNLIEGGNGHDSGAKIEMKTWYEYDLISPRNGKSKYTISSRVELRRITGLDDPSAYYQSKLFVDGKEIAPTEVIQAKFDGETVTAGFRHELEYEETAHVRIELSEREGFPGGGSFVSGRMADLTQGATITCSSAQPLYFFLTLYALDNKRIVPTVTPNMVTLNVPGWMLPGEGFFIDWLRY